MSRELLCKKIELAIMEVVNVATCSSSLKDIAFTQWDDKMKKGFNGLSIPTLTGDSRSCQKEKLRKETQWCAPEKDWIKINFDGASSGNPGPSGIGCVIRDEYGTVLVDCAEFIGTTTNNVVEFCAALRGLELGREVGARKIHLEGDSLLTINAISQKCTPNWNLHKWLDQINLLIADLEDFKVTYTGKAILWLMNWRNGQ